MAQIFDWWKALGVDPQPEIIGEISGIKIACDPSLPPDRVELRDGFGRVLYSMKFENDA